MGYKLYERNGRWYGDFRSMGGRQTALIAPGQKRATTDKRIARAIANDIEKELLRGQLTGIVTGRVKRASFGDYAYEHLDTKTRLGKKLSASHLNDLAKRLEVAAEFFGPRTALDQIDAEDVRRYYLHLTERDNGRGEKLSPATQRAYLSALGGMLEQARREGYTDANPVRNLTVTPVVERPEAQFYEPGDVWNLLEAAKDYDAQRPGSFLHPIVATLAYTGGRQAEVLGLEIEDVDFDSVVVKGKKGAIHFRPNTWRGLKTRGSARAVPMWPDLREILRPFIGERTAGLLFPSYRGGMRRDLRKALDRIGVLAGFPKGHVRTKPFRHTYGSMRIQTVDSGEPVAIYTVSRELGHRDTKMVEQTYGHLLNQRHRRSVVSYRPEHIQPTDPTLSVVA
jgi:integrase